MNIKNEKKCINVYNVQLNSAADSSGVEKDWPQPRSQKTSRCFQVTRYSVSKVSLNFSL